MCHNRKDIIMHAAYFYTISQKNGVCQEKSYAEKASFIRKRGKETRREADKKTECRRKKGCFLQKSALKSGKTIILSAKRSQKCNEIRFAPAQEQQARRKRRDGHGED